MTHKKIHGIIMVAATAVAITGAAHADSIAYQQTFTENPSTLGYESAYANQAVSVTATNLGTPVDKLGNTFTGYTAYLLALSTVTTNNGPVGVVSINLSGPFLQEWTKVHTTITPSPYSPTMASGSYDSGDSHFLINPDGGVGYDGSNGVVVVNAATEDSNQITPAGLSTAASSSGYVIGTGTTMSYNFGLKNASLPTMNLAYLVVPTGSAISFSGAEYTAYFEAGSTTSNYSDAVPFSGTFGAVPEPATMALFTLGGLGILTLGKRRKQA